MKKWLLVMLLNCYIYKDTKRWSAYNNDIYKLDDLVVYCVDKLLKFIT